MASPLSSVGEFGLIRRIKAWLESVPSPRGIVGIGDDAAVFRDSKGSRLTTQDLLVEGTHFHLKQKQDFVDLGWKALAVNLSDMAAMGGMPEAAVVGLALPKSATLEQVRALYRGFAQCARTYACPVVGGDTNATSQGWTVAVTVQGFAKNPCLRSGARPGDGIWVTGELGGSALAWKSEREKVDFSSKAKFLKRLRRPDPRLEWGSLLVRRGWARAMIDVSDGLAGDLAHIAEASGVGCEIDFDAVPRSRNFSGICRNFSWSEEALLLSGGEDYELAFAVPASKEKALARAVDQGQMVATRIGRVVRGSGIRFLRSGRAWDYSGKGFEHFSQAK